MKTKIYGTIGPACHDIDTLALLFEAGMTGIRINLSHSNLKNAEEWIANIRTAYEKVQRKNSLQNCETACMADLEILMDLKGPELRIGKLQADRILEEGDMLTMKPEGETNLFDPTEVPIPAMVLEKLCSSQQILLDDGKLLLEVEETSFHAAECRVIRGGVLHSGKSIALPGVEIAPPTLTESDLENISLISQYGITGVMLPFVRNKQDLLNLKQALEDANVSNTRILAKIENMYGFGQLEELMDYCDEIVIARGDLGNAVPLWKLPVLQNQAAELCKNHGRDFMVVTQMLASMEYAPVPTRAEVSDIFRAVEEGASSVMLTGETAAGKYPVEAMTYMVNTVREAEEYL